MTSKNRPTLQFRVLQILQENEGRPMTAAEIAAALYEGRENGGPDWGETVVRVTIHRLRAKLPADTSIITVPGRGYRLSRSRWRTVGGAAFQGLKA